MQKCKSQSDCSSGMHCVKNFGLMAFCRSAAKKGGMCSVSQGKNGMYTNVPPCEGGLSCQGSILMCH
ncbi:hypothetical protein CDAR_477011 [Caerostris darwini]|uniref:Dickkopf N-terminal cysteine-rich domain-containing protein n=1 Tax=Caerostris darwini TaxID=1538125 RepID=A0AAV4V3H0_9ARAC|nr:hypothetical protein CDAR_477011 [Caerostris darwini]